MRIRTVKPEFWTDDKTGPLGLLAKCLFIGMLNISDDCGILKCSPEEWRVKLFPYQRDVAEADVTAALNEIWSCDLVDIFALSSKPSSTFVFIRNFNKNQVINRPSRPSIPDWHKGDTPRIYAEKNELLVKFYQCDEPPPMLRLTDHSVSSVGRKGKEGNGKELRVVAGSGVS